MFTCWDAQNHSTNQTAGNSLFSSEIVLMNDIQLTCFNDWYSNDQYTLSVWSRGKQLVLFSLESWCFPRLRLRKQRENKANKFPRDHTLSVLLYINLDFLLYNHSAKTNKQRQRVGNNCAIVSWSGYIWIWSGAHDQESTNHGAHLVERKSRYITNGKYDWKSESIILCVLVPGFH